MDEAHGTSPSIQTIRALASRDATTGGGKRVGSIAHNAPRWEEAAPSPIRNRSRTKCLKLSQHAAVLNKNFSHHPSGTRQQWLKLFSLRVQSFRKRNHSVFRLKLYASRD